MGRWLALLTFTFCAQLAHANEPWLSSLQDLRRTHGDRLHVRPCGAGEKPPQCPVVAMNGNDHVLQFVFNASGQLTQTVRVYHQLVGKRSATVQEILAGTSSSMPPTPIVKPRLLTAVTALKQSLGAPDYEDDDGTFWEVLWVRGDTFTRVFLQDEGGEVGQASIERHHIPNWSGAGNYCGMVGSKLAACAPKPETYDRSDFVLLQKGTTNLPAFYASRKGYMAASASLPFPHWVFTYIQSHDTPRSDGTRSSVSVIKFKCDTAQFYVLRTAWFTGPFGDGSGRGEVKAGLETKDKPVPPGTNMELMMRHACKARL